MLAQGALRHHWWNKVPARIWFQNRALREVSCFQAQSEIEVRQVRNFGLRNPVALIPAAVPGKPQGQAMSAREFRSLFRVPVERRIILYLGRLHPVKGLSRLIEAWAKLGPQFSDWLVVLAGPDEGGYEGVLRSQAREAGLADRLVFTGVLDGDQKWGALAAAELFVMPSDFENFGVAIVEAMQAGLPVITTTGTPWKELPAQGAGWCIEPTTGALAAALAEALGLSEEKRRAMGRRAAEVANQFHPEQAATDLIQVYMWLLGRGPKPGCVV
jgi:glycosyltransferase involved in cell wall biosynthesis